MGTQDNNTKTNYVHPPYKEADNISKTDVRYEAPRIPTNQYDVELFKLRMEQLDRDKPFRIAQYAGVFGIGIAAIAFLYWSLKS